MEFVQEPGLLVSNTIGSTGGNEIDLLGLQKLFGTLCEDTLDVIDK